MGGYLRLLFSSRILCLNFYSSWHYYYRVSLFLYKADALHPVLLASITIHFTTCVGHDASIYVFYSQSSMLPITRAAQKKIVTFQLVWNLLSLENKFSFIIMFPLENISR